MATLSRVEIIGAGPAGLYTAILLRRLLPAVQVRVTEQNPQGATFGLGWCFPIRRWISSMPMTRKPMRW
ncbi:MAG: NAD(P)-binding protein [Thiolinea sp.]